MNSVMTQLHQYKSDLESKGHQVYAIMLKGSQNYNLHDSESDVDANAILIPKENADEAMDCATCIGCGACVAACKNGSAMLFVSSKVSQLALLPQGRTEAAKRAKAMVAKMDELGFGNCTNTRACEAVCPKSESIANIARLNREFIKAKIAD